MTSARPRYKSRLLKPREISNGDSALIPGVCKRAVSGFSIQEFRTGRSATRKQKRRRKTQRPLPLPPLFRATGRFSFRQLSNQPLVPNKRRSRTAKMYAAIEDFPPEKRLLKHGSLRADGVFCTVCFCTLMRSRVGRRWGLRASLFRSYTPCQLAPLPKLRTSVRTVQE